MMRSIGFVCVLVFALGSCHAFRFHGPSEDEVGMIFTWKLKDNVAVTDSGCPSQMNIAAFESDMPGSYMWIRLDSVNTATNVVCDGAVLLDSCAPIDEETAGFFPRELSVDGAEFLGAETKAVNELAPGCDLMVNTNMLVVDEGNHGSFDFNMTFKKADVAACSNVQLTSPDGNAIEQCQVDISAEMTLVNVGKP